MRRFLLRGMAMLALIGGLAFGAAAGAQAQHATTHSTSVTHVTAGSKAPSPSDWWW